MISYQTVRRHLLEDEGVVVGTGASESEIGTLVSLWGRLPQDFEQYVRDFGWARIRTYELSGIGRGVPAHANLLVRVPELWRGDGIYKIPRELLPIHESGGGWFYCLSKMHRDQPIVCWAYEHEELGEPQLYDEMYPTWSVWLMSHVFGIT